MKRFLNWLKGFRKKEYTVDLPTEADLTHVDLKDMDTVFVSISRILSNIRCFDASFILNDFKAKKVSSMDLWKRLQSIKKPISHLKVSRTGVVYSDKKEICVIATVFCLGLDSKVWKFEFNMTSIYSSIRNDIETDIVNLIVEYLNGYIELMGLRKMCFHGMWIDDVNHYDSVNQTTYNITMKSFCQGEDYQSYADNMDTDMKEKSDYIMTTIDHKDMENEIHDKSLIVDVIRKRGSTQNRKIELASMMDAYINDIVVVGDLFKRSEYDHRIYKTMEGRNT